MVAAEEEIEVATLVRLENVLEVHLPVTSRNLPEAFTFASTGTVREISSNFERGRAIPKRPAMATRWMMALVEPPSAMSGLMAFSAS